MFYPDVKAHISPSALATWYNAKQSFIKSYFEGDQFTGNASTEFGALIHAMIEGGLLPAKKVFKNCEKELVIPLENGVVALGKPDGYETTMLGEVLEVVDYKSTQDDTWSATEIAGDLKVKMTCWLALQQVRLDGDHPERVVAYIETFQTFYNKRTKKLGLVPDDETEVYEFVYTVEELDAFTAVINKTVSDINEAYMKWLESTEEFVDMESVNEYAVLEAQIKELEAKQEVLKERIGEQMTFGNRDSITTDVGTFYFTTKKKWDYPANMQIECLDEILGLLEVAGCQFCDGSGVIQVSEDEVHQCEFCAHRKTILTKGIEYKDTEAIQASVKSAKLKFETENPPVSQSKSLGFRGKKAKA